MKIFDAEGKNLLSSNDFDTLIEENSSEDISEQIGTPIEAANHTYKKGLGFKLPNACFTLRMFIDPNGSDTFNLEKSENGSLLVLKN